jgi:hypothetical protein
MDCCQYECKGGYMEGRRTPAPATPASVGTASGTTEQFVPVMLNIAMIAV